MTFNTLYQRGCGIILGLMIGLPAVLLPARRSFAAPSVKEIDAAVDKAVAYLIAQQKPDGSWENGPRLNQPESPERSIPTKYATYGGETAISTYALLAAGQSPQSTPIKKAVAWLEKTELHGTYAIGLRAQVWNLLPEKERTRALTFARDRDRDFIFFSRILKGANTGFYSYIYGTDRGGVLAPGMPPMDQEGQPSDSPFDRSNSQYAVLGAWAVEQAGAELPLRYWEDEDAAWKNAQQGDGSWTYNNAKPTMVAYEVNPSGGATVRPMNANDKLLDSVPTMTCAGVATLYITQDYIQRAKSHQFDTCNGGVHNVNIERGLAWLDKHIEELVRFNNPVYHYANYGIERIGVASGRKYLGGVDWFERGSQVLVHTQADNGSWNHALHDTCFSVLFLVRGRAPVMMNKLIYANSPQRQTDPWNERPRDAANLAKWMGKRSLEGFLNWQLVDLKGSVDDLHDAPILYVAGSEPLNLPAADVIKLRQFVEQGGMILGNADCGKRPFSISFKKLGEQLFPKYEFRRLPPGHPIFSEQYLASKWKSHPQLEGMSNGVRELMILIPSADVGLAWQNDSFKTREESFQLGGNIFLYATGKENLRHKGDSYMVHSTGDDGRPIQVARLMIGDNADPEPGGWPHLAAILHNSNKIKLEVIAVKLGDGNLAKYKIAHLTGTTKLVFTDAQRKELKAFVEKGGTLIVDAAGGSSIFAESMEGELKQIFGPAAATALATPLPRANAVFSDPRWKIDDIRYRLFARTLTVGNQTEPRLRAIPAADGRLGVFYSREDLSAGLVGEPVDGILGYDEHVAPLLMRNMILYADGGK